MDKKLNHENKKICRILKNCISHRDVSGLKAIKLVFLPPDTSCDQGSIL